MDPVLLFILDLALVAAVLYFYVWIRSVARKVDQQQLDRRLEELERSVSETTLWLETASAQIRDDLESRIHSLKSLLQDAENRLEVLASERPQTSVEPQAAVPDGSVSAGETDQAPAGAGDDAPSAVAGAPAEATGTAASEPPEAGTGEPLPEKGEPELAPVAVQQPDRRGLILELADQGLSVPEIARRINASRAEIELVVSFRRPR